MISSLPKPRTFVPRPLPYPKLRRLPKVERMTIAVGILSQNGIIIAADTEETGYLKRHQPKILPVNINTPEGPAMAVTGSGDAGYLECISDEIKDCFCQHRRENSLGIENAIRTLLHTFYKKNVIPFAGFPDSDRPNLSLIIGLQINDNPQLLITSKSTLRPAGNFEAVGAGDEFARTLLQRLYPKFPTMDVAEALAAYVIFQVKELIPSCGKSTTIIRIENNHAKYGSTKRTLAMEEIFRSYLQVERAGLGYIFGSQVPDFIKHVEQSFKGMQTALAESFTKFPNEEIETVLHIRRPIPQIKD